MLIDWFTVAAQVINFLVLVWLMKRFLYGPIIHAIDEREKKIAAELADANAKREEAKKEREDFVTKNAVLDQQRANLMNKAKSDAERLSKQLCDKARQAADDITKKRQEALKNYARNLNPALKHLLHSLTASRTFDTSAKGSWRWFAYGASSHRNGSAGYLGLHSDGLKFRSPTDRYIYHHRCSNWGCCQRLTWVSPSRASVVKHNGRPIEPSRVI